MENRVARVKSEYEFLAHRTIRAICHSIVVQGTQVEIVDGCGREVDTEVGVKQIVGAVRLITNDLLWAVFIANIEVCFRKGGGKQWPHLYGLINGGTTAVHIGAGRRDDDILRVVIVGIRQAVGGKR